MKSPLQYQRTEYDCGPTSMLNAISYLFEREEIPPEILRNIMLYSLDSYNAEGVSGKCGTSGAAMMFLDNWLNGFGKTGRLAISSRYLRGKEVFLGKESYIIDALRRGGVAVVRLLLGEGHYVLLNGYEDNNVRMFDPYYLNRPFPQEDIVTLIGVERQYNRIVPVHYFNTEENELYAFGVFEDREAVILFNNKTKLTADKTIEYFI
ncbi:MAG: C39 family peptidase [Lachnospiraceae bacterium]|nr:C39 family peptidase [Lachnospiraceae bacterium]